MERLYSHFTANGILLKKAPFISELAMEGYLLENPGILTIDDDIVPDIRSHETNWTKGANKNPGRIDILALYEKTLAVVELKNDRLVKDHFNQLEAYLSNDEGQLNKAYKAVFGEDVDINIDKNYWMGILVGTGIDPSLEKFIKENDYKINRVPLVVLIINRFKGEGQLFVTTDIIQSMNKKKL